MKFRFEFKGQVKDVELSRVSKLDFLMEDECIGVVRKERLEHTLKRSKERLAKIGLNILALEDALYVSTTHLNEKEQFDLTCQLDNLKGIHSKEKQFYHKVKAVIDKYFSDCDEKEVWTSHKEGKINFKDLELNVKAIEKVTQYDNGIMVYKGLKGFKSHVELELLLTLIAKQLNELDTLIELKNHLKEKLDSYKEDSTSLSKLKARNKLNQEINKALFLESVKDTDYRNIEDCDLEIKPDGLYYSLICKFYCEFTRLGLTLLNTKGALYNVIEVCNNFHTFIENNCISLVNEVEDLKIVANRGKTYFIKKDSKDLTKRNSFPVVVYPIDDEGNPLVEKLCVFADIVR